MKVVASLALFSGTVAAVNLHPTLVELVPVRWQSDVKMACDSPTQQHPIAGMYYSNYIDQYFKLLLLDTTGNYHLMYWDTSSHRYDRSYNGNYTYRNGLVELNVHLNENSLGSDGNDTKLVLMQNDNHHFLLQETALENIGASIQWDGTLGSSEDFYLKIGCEQKLPSMSVNAIKSPAAINFPAALKRFVFEQPVTVEITVLLEKTEDYNPKTRDNEFLVQINKGSDDSFRINMPLRSPKQTGTNWKRWVSSKISTTRSEVRIEIKTDKSGDPLGFAKVGDKLTTSSAQCNS